MKKGRLLIIAGLLLFSPGVLKAQNGFEQLLKAGPADATKLVEAYGKPLLKGFGLGMNSGWTNSAKTLDLFHVDVRVTATGVVVPASDKSFNVSKIGLSSNIGPAVPGKVISPTFSGNRNVSGPEMNIYDDNGKKITSFHLPRGIFEDIVPTPQIQATVGLIQNTDFTVRAMPKVKINKDFGSISLIGFGIKHNIAQDFAVAGLSVPFDFAVAFSYNSLKYEKRLNLQPEGFAVPADKEQSTDFSNQKIYGQFDNYLFQAIFSKKISFFTPYVALGYNTSKAEVGIKGNYPIATNVTSDQILYTTYTDPVKIEKTYVDGFRADMGFELRFPIIRLYASYGIEGNYRLVNAGIGVGL
ncbi:hypothetical protein N180_03160 [Pedobacter antarcticus 4BY]|uniref:Outer membrane protein beta-barrel domain-containing protein n=2 Tax=Pedobacter antarcticus TaxID=34086 RepID=A0A081PKN7_9SPHI|nr:DUF6588 family protein [Pedobacter antarcticus]KEQ31260.1 hypothetical protein N180_03160 [Pedobacter antarcticus 4BY]SFE56720.1 hypothetical protein SAMN03003324_00918 [Pedobacter antarcticus]